MDKPTLDTNYINFLRSHFLNLFETKINPATVIDIFQRYNLKVLTEKDESLVRAETRNRGEIAGSALLFERLVLYDGWYNCLLDVLRDREVKLDYVAEEMEEFKKCLDEHICKTEIDDVDQILLTKCRLKLENEENKNKQLENIRREMECALQQCALEKEKLEEELKVYRQESAELQNKLEACHRVKLEKSNLEEKLKGSDQARCAAEKMVSDLKDKLATIDIPPEKKRQLQRILDPNRYPIKRQQKFTDLPSLYLQEIEVQTLEAADRDRTVIRDS